MTSRLGRTHEPGALAPLPCLWHLEREPGTGARAEKIVDACHIADFLPSPEMSAIRALSNDNLPAPSGIWASPMKKLKFNDEGGKFEVRLHWRVNT